MKLSEVIKTERLRDGRPLVTFPHISRCAGCHGYTGITLPFTNTLIPDPELAWEVELLKFGHQHIGKTANPYPVKPPPCDCAARLPKLKAAHARLVKDDTGWLLAATSNPRRGLHDYVRGILFKKKVLPFQEAQIRRLLELDGCPGWTGVHVKKISPTEWQCTTTNDSSD